jgi:hypothetical protein
MEPPVACGVMDRSIFPESQFRMDIHSWFRAERPGLESCFRTSRDIGCGTIMVVGASYLECTRDGLLRHVVYLGEREDRSAVQVRRDSPPDV